MLLVRPFLNMGLHTWICAEDKYRTKPFNLKIIRRIVTGKTWFTVGRMHAYVHF
jgi:hypothetical protein